MLLHSHRRDMGTQIEMKTYIFFVCLTDLPPISSWYKWGDLLAPDTSVERCIPSGEWFLGFKT